MYRLQILILCLTAASYALGYWRGAKRRAS